MGMAAKSILQGWEFGVQSGSKPTLEALAEGFPRVHSFPLVWIPHYYVGETGQAMAFIPSSQQHVEPKKSRNPTPMTSEAFL